MRIAVVTGTRAEYGLLRTVLDAIDVHPRLELQLVVTGMHLLRKFGHTLDDIVRDGWKIAARVAMQRGDSGAIDQAAGLARGVEGIARFVCRARSDVVVVLGDRIEALAGALAATTTGRILAHIHGGDVAPGDFDDALRHAITKLAHVHFAATRAAADRIVRMGEQRQRVHCVGAPGLDELRGVLRRMPRARSRQDTALVIQHAYGRSAEVERRAATAVLDAVAASGLKRWVIYPNSDRGHEGVLQAIRQHVRRSMPGDVDVARSLSRPEFLDLLCNVRALVGNSSSGIIEAPFVGTPVVDVGDRQAGRQPARRAVVHAWETCSAIRSAIKAALRTRPRRGGRCVYGEGDAGERIAAELARLSITPALAHKQLAY